MITNWRTTIWSLRCVWETLLLWILGCGWGRWSYVWGTVWKLCVFYLTSPRSVFLLDRYVTAISEAGMWLLFLIRTSCDFSHEFSSSYVKWRIKMWPSVPALKRWWRLQAGTVLCCKTMCCLVCCHYGMTVFCSNGDRDNCLPLVCSEGTALLTLLS